MQLTSWSWGRRDVACLACARGATEVPEKGRGRGEGFGRGPAGNGLVAFLGHMCEAAQGLASRSRKVCLEQEQEPCVAGD